jgi:hypothetical protein
VANFSLFPRTLLFYRTLKCALDIVGSAQTLARRMHVPTTELHRWLSGAEATPHWVFLLAVDIVVAAGSGSSTEVLHERRRRPRPQALAH